METMNIRSLQMKMHSIMLIFVLSKKKNSVLKTDIEQLTT